MATIGIFGGTFDPPHIAHLVLASEIRDQMNLDRLLWMLTPDPPHKQNQSIAPLQDRLEMVRLAISDNPDFELSRVEIDRPGPHYAVDTLSIMAEKNPGDHLVYVMGGDSLRDLPTWNRPSEIVARCHAVAVFPRPSVEVDLDELETSLPGLRNKLHFIHAPLLEIAAHEIRRRIKSGQPFRYFLPPRVYAYVISNHLYL